MTLCPVNLTSLCHPWTGDRGYSHFQKNVDDTHIKYLKDFCLAHGCIFLTPGTLSNTKIMQYDPELGKIRETEFEEPVADLIRNHQVRNMIINFCMWSSKLLNNQTFLFFLAISRNVPVRLSFYSFSWSTIFDKCFFIRIKPRNRTTSLRQRSL